MNKKIIPLNKHRKKDPQAEMMLDRKTRRVKLESTLSLLSGQPSTKLKLDKALEQKNSAEQEVILEFDSAFMPLIKTKGSLQMRLLMSLIGKVTAFMQKMTTQDESYVWLFDDIQTRLTLFLSVLNEDYTLFLGEEIVRELKDE